MAYRFWTTEEEATAKAMRADGRTYVEIGNAIGRQPGAVEQALLRMRGGFHKLGRVCAQCPTPISDTNKCGMCRPCNLTRQNYDKEFKSRRLTALLASPSMKAGTPERRNAALLAARKRMANPEYVTFITEHMRNVVGPLSRLPENMAKRNMKRAGRKISERHMAWCPVEYRALYHEVKKAGLLKAEAQQIVFDQIARDNARLSPFERQQRALERGGTLVANDRGHSLDNPGNYGEHRWEVGRVG